MRRRPAAKKMPRGAKALDLAQPRQAPPASTPQSQGDAISSFLVQGGQPFFRTDFSTSDPAVAGVQLLGSQFVPRGFTAWIKRLAAAPYCPPALIDPWSGWPANFEAFEALPAFGLPFARGAARAGLWRTPFGWESYIYSGTEARPSWRWALTLIPGDIAAQRARLLVPPFDPTVPASWYLVPDIAVPASTYPQGLPGRAVPGYVASQRAQVLPDDGFVTHIQIPENNTVCLWAYWTQSSLALRDYAPTGIQLPWPGLEVRPLLASFGMLHGYMQATDRVSAQQNAAFGWGG